MGPLGGCAPPKSANAGFKTHWWKLRVQTEGTIGPTHNIVTSQREKVLKKVKFRNVYVLNVSRALYRISTINANRHVLFAFLLNNSPVSGYSQRFPRVSASDTLCIHICDMYVEGKCQQFHSGTNKLPLCHRRVLPGSSTFTGFSAQINQLLKFSNFDCPPPCFKIRTIEMKKGTIYNLRNREMNCFNGRHSLLEYGITVL